MAEVKIWKVELREDLTPDELVQMVVDGGVCSKAYETVVAFDAVEAAVRAQTMHPGLLVVSVNFHLSAK